MQTLACRVAFVPRLMGLEGFVEPSAADYFDRASAAMGGSWKMEGTMKPMPTLDIAQRSLLSSAERIPTDPERDEPDPTIGLCLSGGGHRAVLFRLEALWRPNDLGFFPRIDRISSDSDGLITPGVLGQNWPRLGLGAGTPLEVMR